MELGVKQEKYVFFCNNQSVINLLKNSCFHLRLKHIDVRNHWIRDALDSKLMELEKIHADDNGSNMLANFLPRGSLNFFIWKSDRCYPPTSQSREFVGLSILFGVDKMNWISDLCVCKPLLLSNKDN